MTAETPPEQASGKRRDDARTAWNTRYAQPGYAFGTEPSGLLSANAHLLSAGQNALVPGDGEGRNGVWLAEQGLEVTTLDASDIGVAKARALATRRGVVIDARVADVANWDWPHEAYDVIACIFLHWPSAERPAIHARMMAALKPGGVILLEAYTPRQLDHRANGSTGGPPDPDMLFEPDALAADFAGLEFVRLEEAIHQGARGSLHTGTSALVHLVARKPARKRDAR